MSTAEKYRVLAAKFDVMARDETNNRVKQQLYGLAAGYRRLSEQADRNAAMDLSYETPIRPRSQIQQQQQAQPTTKNPR